MCVCVFVFFFSIGCLILGVLCLCVFVKVLLCFSLVQSELYMLIKRTMTTNNDNKRFNNKKKQSLKMLSFYRIIILTLFFPFCILRFIVCVLVCEYISLYSIFSLTLQFVYAQFICAWKCVFFENLVRKQKEMTGIMMR